MKMDKCLKFNLKGSLMCFLIVYLSRYLSSNLRSNLRTYLTSLLRSCLKDHIDIVLNINRYYLKYLSVSFALVLVGCAKATLEYPLNRGTGVPVTIVPPNNEEVFPTTSGGAFSVKWVNNIELKNCNKIYGVTQDGDFVYFHTNDTSTGSLGNDLIQRVSLSNFAVVATRFFFGSHYYFYGGISIVNGIVFIRDGTGTTGNLHISKYNLADLKLIDTKDYLLPNDQEGFSLSTRNEMFGVLSNNLMYVGYNTSDLGRIKTYDIQQNKITTIAISQTLGTEVLKYSNGIIIKDSVIWTREDCKYAYGQQCLWQYSSTQQKLAWGRLPSERFPDFSSAEYGRSVYLANSSNQSEIIYISYRNSSISLYGIDVSSF